MLYRLTKVFLVAVLLLALAAGAAYTWVFYGSLPSYSGHQRVASLTSEVRIYRDEHGVPHIFASNTLDAARALGYVHASERLFQMEMNRRAGQGRLSEVIGPSMLDVDTFIRTLGLYSLAGSSFNALSTDAQDINIAYAEGVNGWIETHTHSLPPEFLILGFKPELWKPADSIVWGKLMALELSHNYKLEALRAKLSKKLTPLQIHALFPSHDDAPITTEPKTPQKAETTPEPLDQLGKITGLSNAASNEWVIAGAKTASGKPILANDPHLGLDAPIMWYLARIVTPGFSIKGATVPGLPLVLLGQNDQIAWGFTTTGSDVEDLFSETIDPKNADNYLTPQGSKPFLTRTEIIHVKGQDDVTLKVRATRHGPVLSDIDPDLERLAGTGKVMALAFTGLGARDTTTEALLRLNHAGSWADFLEALRLYQSPPQNIVFANTKGDIGFINPGLVPIRKKGNGLTPVDGSSGTFDWDGTVPFDDLPEAYNPQQGFLFNANNQVTPSTPKAYLGEDWEEPYRAERLQHYFSTITVHTIETSAAMQADHISLVAWQLLPYLLRQKSDDPRLNEALTMLRGWDGTMDKDRAEPLIFEAWLREMHRLLLTEKADNPLKEKGPFDASAIASILSQNEKFWCGKDCNEVVLKALNAALILLSMRDGEDMKKWRWGQEQLTWLPNKVFSHVPFLKDTTNLSIRSSGDFYTLDRGGNDGSNPEHPFIRAHGAGYRGIYDLADPDRSRFMITTGQSGHIFSKHYGDLFPFWNDVKSFTISGSEDQLKARKLPELTLSSK